MPLRKKHEKYKYFNPKCTGAGGTQNDRCDGDGESEDGISVKEAISNVSFEMIG